jgi:hypothetical protein
MLELKDAQESIIFFLPRPLGGGADKVPWYPGTLKNLDTHLVQLHGYERYSYPVFVRMIQLTAIYIIIKKKLKFRFWLGGLA